MDNGLKKLKLYFYFEKFLFKKIQISYFLNKKISNRQWSKDESISIFLSISKWKTFFSIA
jgi:hypothetical protein